MQDVCSIPPYAAFLQNAACLPRIPRVSPWAGMHRPFGAEDGTTLLPGAQISRPRFNDKRLTALVWVSSMFFQPESINIDVAKTLAGAGAPGLPFDPALSDLVEKR